MAFNSFTNQKPAAAFGFTNSLHWSDSENYLWSGGFLICERIESHLRVHSALSRRISEGYLWTKWSSGLLICERIESINLWAELWVFIWQNLSECINFSSFFHVFRLLKKERLEGIEELERREEVTLFYSSFEPQLRFFLRFCFFAEF